MLKLRIGYAEARTSYAVYPFSNRMRRHMFDQIAIEASALRKSFGDHAVLDGIALEVRRGSVFALLGPNGAGKTTMVRILSTLVAPDGGRALVAGHDVVAPRREGRHR